MMTKHPYLAPSRRLSTSTLRHAVVIAFAATLLAAPRFAAAQAAPSADASPDGSWTRIKPTELHTRRASEAVRPWVRPDAFAAVALDPVALGGLLAAAPMEFTEAARRGATATITLPRPDGAFERFAAMESPVMEPELAAWFAAEGFPMKTYKVWSLERPAVFGRIDFAGPHGFHAALRSPDAGQWYIDPYWQFDDGLYAAYYRRDLSMSDAQKAWRCETEFEVTPLDPEVELAVLEEMTRGGFSLRQYRFACAATGEYTQFHGGTVVDGLAALVTMTNRMNDVYEVDLGVRLVLVGNNNLLVYTNPSTDPYSDGNTGTMITQNRTNLMSVIGDANYDVGHVVGANGSGGLAGAIGNVCRQGTGGGSSPHKAQGATTLEPPIGDPFDIDYVAHEVGHQFAGQHSWNHCGGGSGHGLAVEPGSGITIMGYAGLCGSSDIATNSIAMFHVGNIIEMNAYIAGLGNCYTPVVTSNDNAPAVSAGSNYTIPANTPFELTAQGVADADGDTVTISWEQNNSGLAGTQVNPASATSSTTGPVFKAHLPTTNPVQSFPTYSTVLAGGTGPLGERPTTVARTMAFRVIARDNNVEAGRTNSAQVTITSAASTGFAITSPNGGEVLNSGPTNITWNVANTASAPISTANVDVYLSTDGGLTFPTLVASALPNSGSGSVTLPEVLTTTARLKVKGASNVFYDISNGDFEIVGNIPQFVGTGNVTIADTAVGFANSNGFLEPGESQIELTIEAANTGTQGATVVSATLVSLTPTVTVTTAGPFAYPDMASGGGLGANSAPYVIAIDELHACGAPLDFRMDVVSNEGSNSFFFSMPCGEAIGGTPLPLEGFEAAGLPTGWTTAGSGTNNWAVRLGSGSAGTPAAGTRLVSFEPTTSAVTDQRLRTPAVTGVTQLTFMHAYNVEQQDGSVGYDGLVIEVSTNGGSSWIPLASEITTGGYTRTANGNFGSPLATGRAIWAGASASYPTMIPVVVDLSAYVNDTIMIGFRYTEDNCCSGGNTGWFIDNVEMSGLTFQCAPVPVELSGFALD